jgi:hypothetical protein
MEVQMMEPRDLSCDYCGCTCADKIQVVTVTPTSAIAEYRAERHLPKDEPPPTVLCEHCRGQLKEVLLEGGEKKFRFSCADLLITAGVPLDDALAFVEHGSVDDLWTCVWNPPKREVS